MAHRISDAEIKALAKGIAESNKGKPTFIMQYPDGTYYGLWGQSVKTRQSALRVVDCTVFMERNPELKPIQIKTRK